MQETSMASEAVHAHADHAHAKQAFIWRYVFSKDHKVIGIQYYVTAMLMALVAGPAGHADPRAARLAGEGLHVAREDLPHGLRRRRRLRRHAPEFYAMLFTMHGTIMVFFVLSTAPVSGFGNLLIPLQVGARDMAFPFLNGLSYWTFLPGCLVILASFFVETGAAAGGWTSYPPLSALKGAVPGSGTGQTLWIVGMTFFIASFTMGGLNFVTTILNLRTKGLSLFRNAPDGCGRCSWSRSWASSPSPPWWRPASCSSSTGTSGRASSCRRSWC
jgi:cytochrome c oxidase subunit 1